MDNTLACIAGEEVYRQIRSDRLDAESIGPRDTPFGPSGEIFRVGCDDSWFYLLARYGEGLGKTAPSAVPYQANIYALKDLGAAAIVAWGSGGAITHSMAVGDLVVVADVIDQTAHREKTYYPHSPLGYLRQFPVFCPTLRSTCLQTLGELNIVHHDQAVAAVTEGPRLETPAEVRMLGTMGAEVVTHSFIPEMFLARELQMCYAAICYVVNYAETGSRHRPFLATGLFEAPTDSGASRRLVKAMNAFGDVMGHLCRIVADGDTPCTCGEPIAQAAREAGLGEDWRTWLNPPQAGGDFS